MKELLIFVFIFLIVFVFAIVIFNGRFIYAQLKYSFIGMPPAFSGTGQTSSFPFSKDRLLPDKLVIPALGIEAPIIISSSIQEALLQKDLEKGVIYFPGSSYLNENGTMVVLGHSSAYPWYKGQYGSIFALLNKLKQGDKILVFSENKVFNYIVEGKEIKAPKDLVFLKEKDKAVLYLVSCWPINTAWKRIVVRATQTIDKN